MRAEKKQQKQLDIENAAYQLMEEKGFLGMSMLSIAKRARASNETLYNWYGDKNGLFRALIVRNGERVKQLLHDAVSGQQPPTQTLQALGPVLLDLLLGERAIALNRAAAADPNGELGKLLSQAGKESIFPMIIGIFSRCEKLNEQTAAFAAGTYLSLLAGDLQIRRAIGATEIPSKAELVERSISALKLTSQLFDLS